LSRRNICTSSQSQVPIKRKTRDAPKEKNGRNHPTSKLPEILTQYTTCHLREKGEQNLERL
jgi:hypothetical protein